MTHLIQGGLTTLRAWEWVPVTVARILIGIFFCISGGRKLFGKAQFAALERTMARIRTPFPHATALFVATVEFACGAGLALGLLTPVCAATLMADMIVAVTTTSIHGIQSSGFLARLDDFLYLPEVLYVLILSWLIFTGPGRYSLDGLITWGWACPVSSVSRPVKENRCGRYESRPAASNIDAVLTPGLARLPCSQQL